jgi:O-antigen/teichoic acid export membrane protein
MIRKSLLLFSVNTAGRGFQYIYRVVMSHFLTLKEFGILSAALPYQSFVLLFTSMSVTPTVSRFCSQYRISEKEKIFNVFSLLILGLVMGGILYGAAGLFSTFFGAEFQDSQSLLQILAAAVPFAVVLSICTGIFLGHERAEFMAFSVMLYQCLMLFFSYILVQYTGLQGAAHGILLGYILTGGVAVVIALRFGFPVTIIIPEIVKILRFSLPVLAGVVGLWALLNVDTLILARFVSAEEVGVYGMAYPTARLIFGFSVALSALLVPKVSALTYEKGDTAAPIKSSLEVCVLVTLPIAVVIASFSREILYVLFGNPDGYGSLIILSFGMLFYSLFFVGYSALQGLGTPERSMGTALAAAGCSIGLCFLLIPRYGLGGAAFATSLASGLGMGFTFLFLKVRVVPRIQYIVVLLPLVAFEHIVGILESRVSTMVVYGAFGLPFILAYFYLSRAYLHVKE